MQTISVKQTFGMILRCIFSSVVIWILLLEAPIDFCNMHASLPRLRRMQPVGIGSRVRVQLHANGVLQADDACLQLNVGGEII